jgi:1-aminocyclopropane-1-carboxylate synthase 1/2/6
MPAFIEDCLRWDVEPVRRSLALAGLPPDGDGNGDKPGAAAIERAVARTRAAGRAVRALALTSPHNPLGLVYRPDELAGIAAACARLDLDLISDEIYANSVFGGRPFVSALNLPADVIDRRRVHVVWGFAKDFGLPGFKVGVLHTRHPAVRAAARELAQRGPARMPATTSAAPRR